MGCDTPPGPDLLSSSHPFILPAGPSLINHPHMCACITGIIPSWHTLFAHVPHLRVLKVGGNPLEALLACLGNNEDDETGLGAAAAGSGNNRLVPNLECCVIGVLIMGMVAVAATVVQMVSGCGMGG